MADVRIGISGWTYAPWRKTFYPEGLPHRRELAHAAGLLRTIEINGSFYALQKPSSYRRWFTDTPDDFVFSVKAPRFITHMKKLKDVETPVANFFASGVLALEQKLGPVLWQLPPSLGFDAERLRTFFDLLPRTTAEAARLAERHDERMENRAWASTEVDRPLRHVLEVRHDSFRTPEFAKLLREHDIGLVVADTAGRWPQFDEVTADLVYVRLHGDTELYVSGYSGEAIDAWAAKVRTWAAQDHDVFVYFDNDAKVHAPFDAMTLAAKVSAFHG